MRQLATIRTIDAIDPIPGADAIEVATVGGWKVVIKKGEYYAGDLAIYLEIDSWVPFVLAPFLCKGREPRVYEGIPGERLRTVKLRGQVSQGLLLPVDYDHVTGDRFLTDLSGAKVVLQEGDDVSEALGIVKYEPPLSAQLAGEAVGTFPSFIRKTDQERVQNLTREVRDWIDSDLPFEFTEKLDGSSMTVYVRDGEVGVCSRNLDLRQTEGNSFWGAAVKFDLIEKLRSVGRNLAVQGELVGEGIQGNKYKLKGHRFFAFDVYDIDRSSYLGARERRELLDGLEIEQVPLIAVAPLTLAANSVEGLIEYADGRSVLADVAREGVVFKSIIDPNSSFKSISNKWLLKGGE